MTTSEESIAELRIENGIRGIMQVDYRSTTKIKKTCHIRQNSSIP